MELFSGIFRGPLRRDEIEQFGLVLAMKEKVNLPPVAFFCDFISETCDGMEIFTTLFANHRKLKACVVGI